MVATKDFGTYETLDPALGPFEANEEPTKEEQDSLDDVMAEVLKFIHGDNNASVLGSIGNTQDLYQGVGAAAFQILLATKQKFEMGENTLPPAVLFGNGGAVHSTVDEIFQLAQAAGIPGSEDQDQYTAAIMEVMRLAGEYIETSGDDSSVGEAQELLIDVEQTGYQGQDIPNPGEEDKLRGTIQRSLDAQNAALQPEVVENQQAAPQQQSAEPQSGGLPEALV